MVPWFWLLVVFLATIPAGAFAGFLIFASRMNETYTRGRKDGWGARGVYERELRNGRVIEMVEEDA